MTTQQDRDNIYKELPSPATRVLHKSLARLNDAEKIAAVKHEMKAQSDSRQKLNDLRRKKKDLDSEQLVAWNDALESTKRHVAEFNRLYQDLEKPPELTRLSAASTALAADTEQHASQLECIAVQMRRQAATQRGLVDAVFSDAEVAPSQLPDALSTAQVGADEAESEVAQAMEKLDIDDALPEDMELEEKEEAKKEEKPVQPEDNAAAMDAAMGEQQKEMKEMDLDKKGEEEQEEPEQEEEEGEDEEEEDDSELEDESDWEYLKGRLEETRISHGRASNEYEYVCFLLHDYHRKCCSNNKKLRRAAEKQFKNKLKELHLSNQMLAAENTQLREEIETGFVGKETREQEVQTCAGLLDFFTIADIQRRRSQ